MRRSILVCVVLSACGREAPPTMDDGTTGATMETGTSTGVAESTGTTASPGDSGSSSESSTSSASTGDRGSEGSTTGQVCTASDECRDASDCPLPEAECIACACVGGVGCVRWGEGAWGICLVDGMADTTSCEADGAVCLPDVQGAPTGATCVFPECEEPCDCPQPPRGFEAQVACGDAANNGNGVLECFISCENAAACPDGWSCAQELYCVRGGVVTLPPWGDCSDGDLCPAAGGDDGLCIMTATGFVCGTETCIDVTDCPAPAATGTALPMCGDVTGNFVPDCYLDCSNGRECPEGMSCEADTLCVWT